MRELSVGQADRLAVDIGPVITQDARQNIERYIEEMRAAGHVVEQVELSDDTRNGTFVAPTIIEIDDIAELGREVFGPVLHVLRFRSGGLAALIGAINATGYGLTFGLHTRRSETITLATQLIEDGHIYVNGDMVGAVGGVEPFGGGGRSGTGPNAVGPLYLPKLSTENNRE